MGSLHYELRAPAGDLAPGSSRAPVPVLFLHGFMGSHDDWYPIVDRLDGRAALLVDLPGHGRSLGLEGPYSMEQTVTLLAAVLDAANVRRAYVVGYSMGGRAALAFASAHPDRCRALLLESASPGLPSERERRARRKVDEARAVQIETGDYLEFLKEWYRQPLFETYRRQKGLLERVIRARSANSPAELARSLRGMGTGSQPSFWARLEDLHLNAVIVAGALDAKYVEIAERMATLLPRARAVVVPGAGHTVHAEVPNAFSDILADFLKQPS